MSWKIISIRAQDVEVEGHKEGNHTYCSSTNCQVTENHDNGNHHDCNETWCDVRQNHEDGQHQVSTNVWTSGKRCDPSWCDVAKEALEFEDFKRKFIDSDYFLPAFIEDENHLGSNEAYAHAKGTHHKNCSSLTCSTVRSYHRVGDHSYCPIDFCQQAFLRYHDEKWKKLDEAAE